MPRKYSFPIMALLPIPWLMAMSELGFGPQALGFAESATAFASLRTVGMPCRPAQSQMPPGWALLLGVREPLAVKLVGKLME